MPNHGPEDKQFPTPQSVLEVVQEQWIPRCGLCIDCGHTDKTGVDLVESIREAGPRLLSMHIKDLADSKTQRQPVRCRRRQTCPSSASSNNSTRCITPGGVMLEYEIHEDDPLMGMQKSLAYMRGVMAGLRG